MKSNGPNIEPWGTPNKIPPKRCMSYLLLFFVYNLRDNCISILRIVSIQMELGPCIYCRHIVDEHSKN